MNNGTNNFILDNIITIIAAALGKSLLLELPSADIFDDKIYFGKPFGPYYKQYIYPELLQHEINRVRALESMGRRFRIITIVMVIFFVLKIQFPQYMNLHHIIFLKDLNPSSIHFIQEVLFVLSVGWIFKPGIIYQENAKAKIYPLLCKFIGDFSYLENPLITIGNIDKFSLLRTMDMSYNFTDLITGTYKNVYLKLFNLYSTNRKHPFRGLFIMLNINKPFQGKTVVLQDRGIVFNSIVNLFQVNMQPVRLEDPVFENEFEVYSTDQVESRYLLSTSFMQRLLDLKATFESDISCCFFDKELAILISNITFFDCYSVFKRSSFEDDIEIVLSQIQIIFDMIDNLKLNENNRL